jgi:hypothetical protein
MAKGCRPRPARTFKEDGEPSDEVRAAEQRAANGAISRWTPTRRLPQGGISALTQIHNLRGFPFRGGRNPDTSQSFAWRKRTTRMEAALVPGSLSAYEARTGRKERQPASRARGIDRCATRPPHDAREVRWETKWSPLAAREPGRSQVRGFSADTTLVRSEQWSADPFCDGTRRAFTLRNDCRGLGGSARPQAVYWPP